MSTFKLEIAVDNAAFTENRADEIGRCLGVVWKMLKMDDRSEGPIRDINGNRVGTFWFEED